MYKVVASLCHPTGACVNRVPRQVTSASGSLSPPLGTHLRPAVSSVRMCVCRGCMYIQYLQVRSSLLPTHLTLTLPYLPLPSLTYSTSGCLGCLGCVRANFLSTRPPVFRSLLPPSRRPFSCARPLPPPLPARPCACATQDLSALHKYPSQRREGWRWTERESIYCRIRTRTVAQRVELPKQKKERPDRVRTVLYRISAEA